MIPFSTNLLPRIISPVLNSLVRFVRFAQSHFLAVGRLTQCTVRAVCCTTGCGGLSVTRGRITACMVSWGGGTVLKARSLLDTSIHCGAPHAASEKGSELTANSKQTSKGEVYVRTKHFRNTFLAVFLACQV